MRSRRMQCFLGLAIYLPLLLPASKAEHPPAEPPSEITLRVGFIPGETFGGFQRDLMDRLEKFALQDDIRLTLQVQEIQELYSSNLPLISSSGCHHGETIFINEVEYNCDDFDMLVGDFWPNPE
jgi:hypothetical protein